MTASAPEATAARELRTSRHGGWRLAVVVSFLLLSLLMLSDVTRNPTRFGEFYTPLIVLTVAGRSSPPCSFATSSSSCARCGKSAPGPA